MKLSVWEKLAQTRIGAEDKFPKGKLSSPFEWLMSAIVTLTIIVITILGGFLDLAEYAHKYYGAWPINYNPQYREWLAPLTLCAYVYFYARLFLQKKLNNGLVNLTWDLTAVMLVFLVLQLFIVLDLNFKWVWSVVINLSIRIKDVLTVGWAGCHVLQNLENKLIMGVRRPLA